MMNVHTYRQAIDTYMDLKEPILFHLEAAQLAPNWVLKLHNRRIAQDLKSKQDEAYSEIERHEEEGFRVSTPFGNYRKFKQVQAHKPSTL